MLAECKAPLGQFDEARELYRRSKEPSTISASSSSLRCTRSPAERSNCLRAHLRRRPRSCAPGTRRCDRWAKRSHSPRSLPTSARRSTRRASTRKRITSPTSPRQRRRRRTSPRRWSRVERKPSCSPGTETASARRAFAREAVEQAARTDAINMQADALMNLAEVLRLSDREDEARRVFRDASEVYERKGNLVSQGACGPRLRPERRACRFGRWAHASRTSRSRRRSPSLRRCRSRYPPTMPPDEGDPGTAPPPDTVQ